jgi:hypothetical protein
MGRLFRSNLLFGRRGEPIHAFKGLRYRMAAKTSAFFGHCGRLFYATYK